MVAWRYESSLLVLKKIFHSFAALTRKYSKRNFVSPRGHVISSISEKVTTSLAKTLGILT